MVDRTLWLATATLTRSAPACDALASLWAGYLSRIPIIEKKIIIPAYPAAPTIRSQSVHSIIYLYVSHCAAVREAFALC